MKSSYTIDETNKLKTLYVTEEREINEIAEIMDKPISSIRSKLVKEGVYKKVSHKSSKRLPSKKELVREIEELSGLMFPTLASANKLDLLVLTEYLKHGKNTTPNS